VLFKTGVQVPVTPLTEVVGNEAKAAPEQIGATGLNVGVNTGSILIETVVDAAEVHCPGFGVKVYGKVPKIAVFTIAGLQVPVIGVAFEEFKGKTGAGAP
jgi:hypothetical protein